MLSCIELFIINLTGYHYISSNPEIHSSVESLNNCYQLNKTPFFDYGIILLKLFILQQISLEVDSRTIQRVIQKGIISNWKYRKLPVEVKTIKLKKGVRHAEKNSIQLWKDPKRTLLKHTSLGCRMKTASTVRVILVISFFFWLWRFGYDTDRYIDEFTL